MSSGPSLYQRQRELDFLASAHAQRYQSGLRIVLPGDQVPFTVIEVQCKKRQADQKRNREAEDADNEKVVRRYECA